jgi:hypothetical protein
MKRAGMIRYPRERLGSRPRRKYARAVPLFVIVFIASGMDGGSCAGPVIPPNGNGNGNGSGGPTILSSDHILGSATAPLTVVEYLDFQ